ncbi:hypothetical protein IFM89_034915 [Coptis chinensis]|uniref:J domain-containing protein n=1 Tax=Coptis chinensis TaxID=261450 RepID=A0A835I7T2_9MAGN|nr:hypothetical protein IFM89_034915 [Coptis chinensis]
MGRKKKCRDTSSSSSESDTDTSSLDRKSRRHNRSRDDKYTRRRSKGSRRDKRRKKRDPETVLGYILGKFPDVVHDLKQLLQMIDGGQAVDTTGISDRYFVKQLRKLFVSLNLKESDDGIFLLPPKCRPTLEVVGPMMSLHERLRDQKLPQSGSNIEPMETTDDADGSPVVVEEDPAPRRRVIGPEMPSSELLAAAAKLTEATAELRDAEFEFDNDLFIGPAPPAVAAEAASSNEAERFEEVTRIMEVETGSPYDLLGVNRNMSADNIKKRYWKLSLMVHPDKCSHPQAHQAFVKLNEGFKELQDPDKRKAMDDKIRLKEEQEEFKAELKVMREAAQWRRLQGISMEGDDELLAETKMPPKRDEWMTTLPPERKVCNQIQFCSDCKSSPGVTVHSATSFSRTNKEGRGDTSVWTDTPEDKTQKAKMNYLEAYNEAAALASNEEKKRTSSDADLVDKYNITKRSKSLVEKHQEESANRRKRKSKQEKTKEKDLKEQKEEEWVGKHPWKPWDREKDLTAGRQNVNLDSENMVKGLSSRFSGGNVQRNFL